MRERIHLGCVAVRKKDVYVLRFILIYIYINHLIYIYIWFIQSSSFL